MSLFQAHTRHVNFPTSDEISEWRLCYEGGQDFRLRYLTRRCAHKPNGEGGYVVDEAESEAPQDFIARRDKTPTPTYGKRAINKIRNALVQRFCEIVYRGGSDALRSAISGADRGVDLRGRSLNDFIADCILSDLLVIGKIGAFVDFPQNPGTTVAEVVANRARPFLYTYPVEEIHDLIPADRGDTSDWKHVSFIEQSRTVERGVEVIKNGYRAFDKVEKTNRVTMQTFNEAGTDTGKAVELSISDIPFVLFDLGESLIKDACSYQIQLLNLMSNDTAYCMQANYPFMVRQRHKNTVGEFINHEDKKVATGERKGLWYDQGLSAPAFISPPSDPIEASIMMRQESKKEVEDIVNDALMSAANASDGIGAGLAFVGGKLQSGVQALLNHWAAYESKSPQRRQFCTVKFPDRWAVQTMAERIEECDALAKLQFSVPSRTAKKAVATWIVDKFARDVFSLDDVETIKAEIAKAKGAVGDPETVIKLKEQGLMSVELGVEMIGSDPEDAAKSLQDQADRMALASKAQERENADTRGDDDGKADPTGDAQLDKEASRDTDGEPTTESRVRGEGRDTQE